MNMPLPRKGWVLQRTVRRASLWALWFGVCWVPSAWAQAQAVAPIDPNSDAQIDKAVGLETAAPGVGGLGWQLFQTLLMLGVVVALIYVTLNYGLRKLLRMPSVKAGATGAVQVLERIPLEPKRSLYVVLAAGDYWLLGSSEAGLAPIAKLDAVEVEKLRTNSRSQTLSLSPFLQKLLARKDETKPSA